MTVARFVQPNYTTQSAAAYKANLDAAIAAFLRVAGAFAPHQTYGGSPNPDRSVELDAGLIWNGSYMREIPGQIVSGFAVVGSGLQRIDLVVVDAVTGVASIVAGFAQSSGSPGPSAPAPTTGKFPVCEVLLTSSDTLITNSMITDRRPWGFQIGAGEAKAEGEFNNAGAIQRNSAGLSSVADNGAGDFTVTTSRTFSGSDMTALVSIISQGSDTEATTLSAMIHTLTTTTARIQIREAATGARTDPTSGTGIAIFGTLA